MRKNNVTKKVRQKDVFSYSIYEEEGIPTEEAAEWLEGWIR